MMRDYNFMSPHAKKVMRLSAMLFWELGVDGILL